MSTRHSDCRQQFLEHFAALSDLRPGSRVASYRKRGEPSCRYGGSRTTTMQTVNEWCRRHRHDVVYCLRARAHTAYGYVAELRV